LISARIATRSLASRLDSGSSNRKHLRVAHDGAAHGHALALPARELAWVAAQQRVEVENLRGARHALVGHGLLGVAQAQAEAHVLAHRHVRVERVALEHHRDVAVLRLEVVDHASVDHDLAAADVLQAREHAQQRRLAAARRADQHHELAVGDVEAQALDDLDLAEGFLDVAKGNGSHFCVPGFFAQLFTAPAVRPPTM
jgi:hypothetical protein